MSMTKLILPGSQDFGEATAQLVKYARNGLTGSDLGALIKRAGHKMADAVQKLAFAPGEIPIHLLAIGSTEFYGPNRNGDGFTEDCCRKYHDTFVKHARWYRNHQNKDPEKSYGTVKFSCYNEPMHRLELVVALNGTKEAAMRNRGLVADRELQMLASGKDDWGVSMACKVAYDVCSGCGNRARTRADYCTESTCKYGGVKNNMCKVAEDGHINYVDNPEPSFFDISDVSDTRPADRIAYVFGKMQKAASAAHIMGGAALAAEYGVSPPLALALTNVSDRQLRDQIKLAFATAEVERNVLHNLSVKTAAMCTLPHTQVKGVDGVGRDSKKCGLLLKAAAREKIALSLPDFLQFTTTCTAQQAHEYTREIQPHLQGVFVRLCEDTEKLAEDLRTNPFRPADREPTLEWEKWARENRANGSLDYECVQRRAFREAIREERPMSLDMRPVKVVKTAAHENIARAYGLYKLAFLHEIRDSEHFQLTSDLVVRQNYVS